MDRRNFLKQGFLASVPLGAGFLRNSSFTESKKSYSPIKIGLCTDLHQDLIPDAPERLSAFIDEMIRINPDFIIQLGDFCQPRPENKKIMDIWNRFSGPKYHVIGNHDPEGSFSQNEVVNFWGIPGKYYSFDLHDYHFVVLNGNENPPHRTLWKYERYISKEQLEWLEEDLRKTDLPVIVFCHQGLDNDKGIENSMWVRLLLESANIEAGFQKVKVVFTGHHHQDYHNVINGIHYIQINSMSYHWQGEKYSESPFGDELNKKYPLLKYMAHYKEPLWAVAEISESGVLNIHGKKTTFFGRSPQELGMPAREFAYPVVSYISDRKIKLSDELHL